MATVRALDKPTAMPHKARPIDGFPRSELIFLDLNHEIRYSTGEDETAGG